MIRVISALYFSPPNPEPANVHNSSWSSEWEGGEQEDSCPTFNRMPQIAQIFEGLRHAFQFLSCLEKNQQEGLECPPWPDLQAAVGASATWPSHACWSKDMPNGPSTQRTRAPGTLHHLFSDRLGMSNLDEWRREMIKQGRKQCLKTWAHTENRFILNNSEVLALIIRNYNIPNQKTDSWRN